MRKYYYVAKFIFMIGVWANINLTHSSYTKSIYHAETQKSTQHVTREEFLMHVGEISSNLKSPCMFVDDRNTVPCQINNCQCDHNTETVICRKLNLTSVPDSISNSTRALILSHNNFRVLNDTTFKPWSDIEVLFLDSNSITKIDAGAFKGLPKLCSLNLSRNKFSIKVLETSVFCAMTGSSLQMLNVSKIGLYRSKPKLTDHAMACLRNTSIGTLDLSYDRPLCNMENGTFAGMDSLRQPFFTLMQCVAFNTFALRGANNIEDLHLSRNELPYIPIFGWRVFPNASLPGQPLLPKLTKLVLDHNKISTLLKSNSYGLEKLKHLNLGSNDIYFINNYVIKRFSSLEVLLLNDNRIKKIWGHGLDSPTLKTITLFGNPFPLDGNYSLFASTQNITNIYMGFNMGFKLPTVERIFQNLSTLNVLSFSYMQGFMSIPGRMFRGLHNLKTLSLQHNIIKGIDHNLFRDLDSLEELNLSSNIIDTINSTSLPRSWKTKLRSIDLHNNPWDCSCELLWFVDWLKENDTNLKNIKNYRCAYPPENKGIALLNLTDVTADSCLGKTLSKNIVAAIVVSVVMTTAVIILSALYRYRWHLQRHMFYFHLRMMSPEGTKSIGATEADAYHFDAFVSYNQTDLPWVKRILLNELEIQMKPPLKLCLFERDWLGGHDLVDCIEESLDISRKIVLLVTNAYARSQWCQLELTMAQHNLLESDNDNVILAIMEDIDPLNLTPRLVLEMKRKAYLKWTEDATGQRLFWEKLKHLIKGPNISFRQQRPKPEEIDAL